VQWAWRAICRGAGVSPAFLQSIEIRKIAGETPAPRKACVPPIWIVLKNKGYRPKFL
jgi:hypothetical protein